MNKLLIYLGTVLMLIATSFAVITTFPIIQTDITQSDYVNISSGSLVLNDLLDGKQNYSIAYNTSVLTSVPVIDELFYSGANSTNYTIDTNTLGVDNVYVVDCAINSSVDGVQTISGSYSEPNCNFTFEINQSSSNNTIEYGLEMSDGSYEFIDSVNTLTFIPQNLYYTDNTKLNNLDLQHFNRTYIVVNYLGVNLTNISWSLNTTNDINIFNISTGVQNFNKSIESDIITEDTYYSVNASSVFAYGTPYKVWKLLNITNPYATAIDGIELNFTMLDFNNNHLFTKYNGTEYVTFASSNVSGNLSTTISSMTSLENDLYNISFDADIITKTMPKARFVVEGGDGSYERHYYFSPNASYYTNFDGLGTITITDLLDTATYIPDWNNRLRYSVDGSYNSSTLSVNTTPNDYSLGLNFTIDDALLTSRFQLDYYVPEYVSDSTGSSGGGGGASSTVIVEIPSDVNKSECDITISPAEVILNDDNTLQEMIFTNDENQIINPEFAFLHIDGDSEITDNLQIVNYPASIQAKTSTSFGIRLGTLAPTGDAEAQLIVSSSQCKNVIVPIAVSTTGKNVLAELFNTPLSELPAKLRADKLSMTFVTDNAILDWLNSVWGITVLMAVIFFGLLIPTRGSMLTSRRLTDVIARFILWLLGTSIVLLIAINI